MTDRLGRALFTARSWTPLPLIVALLVIARPTPLLFALGAAVAAAGEALRIAALRHLDATARGRRFHATALATGGPFGVVRNPLYLGNALIVAGICVAGGATRPWFLAIVAAAYLIQYLPIIAAEEAFLAERFAGAFARYRARVPRLLPLRAPARGDATAPRRALGDVLRGESRTFSSLGIVLGLIVVKGFVVAGP